MRASRSPASGARSSEALAAVRAQPPMAGRALVARVSTRGPYVVSDAGRTRRRRRRLRRASARSCAGSRGRARRSPSIRTTPTADELARCDGVLLSNGPGDPEPLTDEAAAVRDAARPGARCSGSASATSSSRWRPGHETYKLPFGHRGANHPVLERATEPRARHQPEPRLRGRAERGREATHVSLYDGTVEELRLPERARALGAVPSRGRARAARRPGRSSSAGSRRCACLPKRPDLALDLPDRLGADRDRAGVRVRLRRLPGAARCSARTGSARSSSTRTRRRS